MHKTEILKYLLDKIYIDIDKRLNEAYELTSKYREFNKSANIDNCEKELDEIINLFYNSSLEQFKEIAKTLSC